MNKVTPKKSGTTPGGIYFEVHGSGKPLFLAFPIMASHGEIFGANGAQVLQGYLESLCDRYSVLLVDYPSIGKSAAIPPGDLTADRVCADMLEVADAAGFDQFAWWGYSWGAVVGLQLASRTKRLSALVIGGWPPLGGPYADMLKGASVNLSNPPDYAKVVLRNDAQYAQWAAFYGSVQDWPEAEAVAAIACPRMTYVGANSLTDAGGIELPFAALLRQRAPELRAMGWWVREIPNQGHAVALEPAVLVPVVREFLDDVL